MPRIPVVSTTDAGFLTKLMYRFAAKRYGAVPEPFAVAAHHPALMRTNAVHELLAERSAGALPDGIGELAVYRTATQLGCSWCVDFGTMLQRLEGLDVERLKDIDNYRTSPRYTHAECLAIAYADAMTTTPVSVTDEQVAELEREFGRKGVIELTYSIGLENMRARMNCALEITDQGFTSGDACQVPMPGQDTRSGVQG